MTKIAKNLTDLIGNTPLLELSNFNKSQGLESTLIAKLEYFNPLGSVKDRIGFAMIKDAEDKGLLKKDSVIIELTSGNTGVALAFVAAAKGYRLILTMPETFSIERRNLLKALGAELVMLQMLLHRMKYQPITLHFLPEDDWSQMLLRFVPELFHR
jgi:cysteine synthase A